MKLITDGVWSTSKTHLKILKTAEECMKLHLVIPFDVLKSRSRIKGNFSEYIIDLCKLKFLSHWEHGYKLTHSGYDCLAINTLRARGLQIMGERIGIGKESDIYLGIYGGKDAILKFHRLGRTSFRTVKNNRGYVASKVNWLVMCKVSCRREVAYLEMFKDMEVPTVLDYNRHVVVQELLDYKPLYKTEVTNVETIFNLMLNFIRDLWTRGYVHGDFNEFNVMVNEDIKVIDFPQCIENTNEKALHYLRRDFNCVLKYFKKKYDYEPESDCSNNFMRDLGINEELLGKEFAHEDSESLSECNFTDEDLSREHKKTNIVEAEIASIYISKNPGS